ncbi:MAG: hypothetical protein J7605_04480 [Variovorax sp.]|nr:hypothetical protein [Variovorax sp.]
MIFDSKRRQTAELEAEEATALAEAPRAERSVAPDDLQASPQSATRRVDEEVYQTEDPPVERMSGRTDPRHAALRGSSDADDLAPLFSTDVADDFRRVWDAVQIGFVDDPRKAVRDADELVNRVLQSLTETFRGERGRVEDQVAQGDAVSTENLRMALRRYRSFLHRLLSL